MIDYASIITACTENDRLYDTGVRPYPPEIISAAKEALSLGYNVLVLYLKRDNPLLDEHSTYISHLLKVNGSKNLWYESPLHNIKGKTRKTVKQWVIDELTALHLPRTLSPTTFKGQIWEETKYYVYLSLQEGENPIRTRASKALITMSCMTKSNILVLYNDVSNPLV